MTKSTETVTELFENGIYRMTEVRTATAYDGGTFVSHQYEISATTETLENNLDRFLPSIYVKKGRVEGREKFKVEISAAGHSYMGEAEFETYIKAAKYGQMALKKAQEIIACRQNGVAVEGAVVLHEYTEEA